jgi:hypothetical protein
MIVTRRKAPDCRSNRGATRKAVVSFASTLLKLSKQPAGRQARANCEEFDVEPAVTGLFMGLGMGLVLV